jgi:uncharacterized phage-associated protein
MHPDARLRELILYIAEKCGTDPEFSATRVNKIFFYADFLSFARTGTPITGAAYQALEHGPVPKRLLPVRKRMVDSGELEIRKVRKYTYSRHQYVALRSAKLDEFFKPSDIALVDEIIEAFRGTSAQTISRFSHHRLWRIARGPSNVDGPIPYEAMYISDDPQSDSDVARANELVAQHGWDVQ